ncbi:MAG TPA: hypothetical protein VE684_11520, partial [Crenalkalicoccus sp.]|nr:hypothetical protein [Crenalkalicoccus sp.]
TRRRRAPRASTTAPSGAPDGARRSRSSIPDYGGGGSGEPALDRSPGGAAQGLDRRGRVARGGGALDPVVLAIAALAMLHAFAAPFLFDLGAGLGAWPRGALAVALIAPLAFAMGLPFPLVLGRLRAAAPALVPWAWGVNGCASVIAAVLAGLVAMGWGNRSLAALGVLAYLLAAFAQRGIRPPAGGEEPGLRRRDPVRCGARPRRSGFARLAGAGAGSVLAGLRLVRWCPDSEVLRTSFSVHRPLFSVACWSAPLAAEAANFAGRTLERFHHARARRKRSSLCIWRIFYGEPRTLRLKMR